MRSRNRQGKGRFGGLTWPQPNTQLQISAATWQIETTSDSACCRIALVAVVGYSKRMLHVPVRKIAACCLLTWSLVPPRGLLAFPACYILWMILNFILPVNLLLRQCKLVSGWGRRNRRSASLYGLYGLGRTLRYVYLISALISLTI